MAGKWYRNPFYWLAILAFLFAVYIWSYQYFGTGVAGLGDVILIFLHIPREVFLIFAEVVYWLSLFGILVLPLWIIGLAIYNAVQNRKKRKSIARVTSLSKKRIRIISELESLFDTVEKLTEQQNNERAKRAKRRD